MTGDTEARLTEAQRALLLYADTVNGFVTGPAKHAVADALEKQGLIKWRGSVVGYWRITALGRAALARKEG